MKERKKIGDRLSLRADLAGESMPRQPLVELLSHSRVIIENHRGVVQYGCQEICIKVEFGYVKVCGQKLELAKMTKEQLVIIGSIDSVCLDKRGK